MADETPKEETPKEETTEKAAEPAAVNVNLPAGFDAKQTHVVHQWKATAPLIWCRFAPSGKYVYSSSEDMKIQRWEFPSGKLVAMDGHDSWPRDILVTPDSKTVVTFGCDEQMIFWPGEGDSLTPVRKVKAHDGWIRCAALSPTGDKIATGGNDKLVKLWNTVDGTAIRQFDGHDSHVYSVLFHPDGQWLLSGDLSGKVNQWEIETGKLLRTFDAAALHSYNGGQQVHYGGVRSIDLSLDKKLLACGGLHKATNPLGAVNEPLIEVFDWEKNEKVRSLVSDGVKGIAFRSIFLGDGSVLCASGGSGGGFLIFWQPGEDKSYHKLKLPDTARGLDIHPDKLHVATVHADRNLRISKMAAKTG
ncbi:MAG: WD40 repeat protein [Pirellulaceae bacterium]|jgi:WD40 repeat protein